MKETEDISMRAFGSIVPRNLDDWFGNVCLYDAGSKKVYQITFGSGDNLTEEDIHEGYDDYIMVERYGLDGDAALEDILSELKENGGYADMVHGLEEEDGGQMLLKRSEWSSGNIVLFISDALDFCGGYPVPTEVTDYSDLIYVAGSNQ